MTLKNHILRTSLNASLFLAIFLSILINPLPVGALDNGGASLPDFQDFSETVRNSSQADVLRGVYVPEVLALPVVQQPAGNAGYVSPRDGEITQFGMVSQFGNVGLLAHNHLSGKSFSQLAPGQEVRLVYGNGRIEYFVITELVSYQALQPTSPYSSFRSLDGRETLTAEQMFKRVYFGDRHVTFQTCVEANGNLSWGRLFIIAIPRAEYIEMKNFDYKMYR